MVLDQHEYVNQIYAQTDWSGTAVPTLRKSGGQNSERRVYIPAVVCLGLLCFLLVMALIVLSVYHAKAVDNIKKEDSVLAAERDQIVSNLSALRAERDELQMRFDNSNNFLKLLANHVCPSGWRLDFTMSCYYTSTLKKTWGESQADCTDRGAHLVIINSSKEQALIANLKGSFWIGLRYDDSIHTWKWVDGTTVSQEKAHWNPDQPDNYMGMEKCVESSRYYDNRRKGWNDLPCGNKMQWICEKEITSYHN